MINHSYIDKKRAQLYDKNPLICHVYYILTQVSAMLIVLVESLLCVSFYVSILFYFALRCFFFIFLLIW